MNAFMFYQLALYTEYLITRFTIVLVLNVYALMSYQTALLNECPITHSTLIRALTTMYALMCY